MKYTLLSLGVLALCLAFSLFSMGTVTSVCDRTAERLSASLDAVRRASPAEADAAIRQAERIWAAKQPFLGTVLRHEEMDAVMTGIAELHAYLETDDLDDYQATCARLLAALRHLKDMEKPTAENIL